MIVDEPYIHVAILRDDAVIERGRERRQRMQRFTAERRIDTDAEGSHLPCPTVSRAVHYESPGQAPQRKRQAAKKANAAKHADFFERRVLQALQGGIELAQGLT